MLFIDFKKAFKQSLDRKSIAIILFNYYLKVILNWIKVLLYYCSQLKKSDKARLLKSLSKVVSQGLCSQLFSIFNLYKLNFYQKH